MRWGTRRLRLLGGALLAPVAAVLLVAGSAASPAPLRVRIGAAPSLARDESPIGPAPASATMHVTVVLKGRDGAGLTRLVKEVSDPGSPFYHAYLTPLQFGERFGATPATLRAVRASLLAHGLRPGSTPPDRLSIPVMAPASAIEHAFSIQLERVALAHGMQATVANAAPAVDAAVAPAIQSVIGLNGVAAPHPLLVRPTALSRRSITGHERPHVQTGGPQPCAAASSTAARDGAYTADGIASAYGFPGLYGAGNLGRGVTIAIYELEPNDPTDIAAYQACYGTHTSVTYIQVDNGPGSSGPGSGEAALDIENVLGLAPQANLLVYQAPNANQSVPGSGPFDLFSKIINDDKANVVSVSWGECERLESPTGAAAESKLFAQAAVEGQSIVSASGDSGSEDCNGANNVPDPTLAVDDPSSQPFVTGVGGTSLSHAGPPPSQTTWNGGGSVVGLTGVASGAGGGGVSSFWGMPGYQSSAASALNVVGPNSSRSACGASSGFCRQTPDVSADADPQTGYVVYYNGQNSDPAAPSGWQAVGGTSAAAPVWAAVLALTDATSACHGSPLGFANPALYKAAASAYSSIFSDVTTGNNDFTGTNHGLFPAGPGYDMTTGLGTPNAAPLAAAICQNTVRIRNPGSLRATVGQPVSLRLGTTGPTVGSLTWVSNGLPAGLALSRSAGTITGRPTKLGTDPVVVGVLDSSLAVAAASFTWTIQGPPSIIGASIRGVRSGRPALAITVTAGRGAPGLRKVTIALPAPLHFARARVTVVGAGGSRARLVGGQLQLTVSGSPRRITLAVAYPAITTRSRARRHRPFKLSIRVIDSGQVASTLTASARSRG